MEVASLNQKIVKTKDYQYKKVFNYSNPNKIPVGHIKKVVNEPLI